MDRNGNRKAIPVDTRWDVIERDNATCQMCGKVGHVVRRAGKPSVVEPSNHGKNGQLSFHFHHIIPVFLDGTNDKDNLELRCQKCNATEKLTDQVRDYVRSLRDNRA